MAVLEAWAYALPAGISDHCNIPEGYFAGAALEVEPTPGSIATGLPRLFWLSDAERVACGKRGRELVEHRFTWKRIARDMAAVYAWQLGGGRARECISGQSAPRAPRGSGQAQAMAGVQRATVRLSPVLSQSMMQRGER